MYGMNDMAEQIPVGHLPDFEGKPVLASCTNCEHCFDDSDGWEYGPAFYNCDKNPKMANLKGFPFKTPQKCCELNISFMVNWDEEYKKAAQI